MNTLRTVAGAKCYGKAEYKFHEGRNDSLFWCYSSHCLTLQVLNRCVDFTLNSALGFTVEQCLN